MCGVGEVKYGKDSRMCNHRVSQSWTVSDLVIGEGYSFLTFLSRPS